jgi:hypothetical protein
MGGASAGTISSDLKETGAGVNQGGTEEQAGKDGGELDEGAVSFVVDVDIERGRAHAREAEEDDDGPE